jgi:hypothetical protein
VYPHLDTMMRMVCNQVNTINDLFSLYAEMRDNDSHNMVLVRHRQGLPLVSAVRHLERPAAAHEAREVLDATRAGGRRQAKACSIWSARLPSGDGDSLGTATGS